jgi:hypothetical protein
MGSPSGRDATGCGKTLSHCHSNFFHGASTRALKTSILVGSREPVKEPHSALDSYVASI